MRTDFNSTPPVRQSTAAKSAVRRPTQCARPSQPNHPSPCRPAAVKRTAKRSAKISSKLPKPPAKQSAQLLKRRTSRLARKKIAAAEERAILSSLRATIGGAIQTAAEQIQLVHAALSADAPVFATPTTISTTTSSGTPVSGGPVKPTVQQYDIRSMMVMAASAHSVLSLFSTREALEASEVGMLLNEPDQGMHKDSVDEWCDYAMMEEEERMNSSLPQKFRSPSPPRRYSNSCVEVKMGKISAGAAFEHKGTPARATFRPIRKAPPSWAAKHKH